MPNWYELCMHQRTLWNNFQFIDTQNLFSGKGSDPTHSDIEWGWYMEEGAV
jgi:hypothetical protein